MKIENLTITRENNLFKISVSIESAKLGRKNLWFSTPEKFGDCICSTRMDGFLVGMLFPAMQYGEDIHISGCVSEKLIFNINNYVIPLLAAFSPTSKKINVTADEISSNIFDTKGVGTGFSAGVDSFCTIYNRLELEKSSDYKVNSFLFLNVGSHGMGDTEGKREIARNKFITRYEYLKKFPESLGLDFIPLDSNLHEFHPWGHLKTDTLTSNAGILIMQGYFKRYYYSTAGFSYSDQLLNGANFREVSVADCCDPMIAPLLSTESLDFVLDGMQYNRNEKLLHILEYSPVKSFLNVCINSALDSHTNCSICAKCCRTLMALESIGRIDEFAHLFDIKKYSERAKKYYTATQVLQQDKDPFAHGNILLAKKNGMSLPPIPVAFAISCFYKIKNIILFYFFKCVKCILSEKIRLHLKQNLQHKSK
jgi:hypothetical protein